MQRVEWFQTFSEWDDECVDNGTDGCVVVERDDGVHLFISSTQAMAIDIPSIREGGSES